MQEASKTPFGGTQWAWSLPGRVWPTAGSGSWPWVGRVPRAIYQGRAPAICTPWDPPSRPARYLLPRFRVALASRVRRASAAPLARVCNTCRASGVPRLSSTSTARTPRSSSGEADASSRFNRSSTRRRFSSDALAFSAARSAGSARSPSADNCLGGGGGRGEVAGLGVGEGRGVFFRAKSGGGARALFKEAQGRHAVGPEHLQGANRLTSVGTARVGPGEIGFRGGKPADLAVR